MEQTHFGDFSLHVQMSLYKSFFTFRSQQYDAKKENLYFIYIINLIHIIYTALQ